MTNNFLKCFTLYKKCKLSGKAISFLSKKGNFAAYPTIQTSMKKELLFTLLLAVICQLALAQSASSVFNDFRDKKNANYYSIPKLMLTVASSKLKDGNYKELLQQVKEVKILNLGDCSKSVRKKFAKKIGNLSGKGYDNFTGMKSGKNKDISLLVKQDGDNINELVGLVHESSSCLGILITGNIKTESIASLIGLVDDL